MIKYKLKHLFSYTSRLANPPEIIGPTPEGLRITFYSIGGEITGPKLIGKVLPTGGDWMTVRQDGIGVQDVRTTFKTTDGALILVRYAGLIDFGPNGYKNVLAGNLPKKVALHSSPRFMTSHPDYAWLNRCLCVGIGEYDAASNAATYDVYAIG